MSEVEETGRTSSPDAPAAEPACADVANGAATAKQFRTPTPRLDCLDESSACCFCVDLVGAWGIGHPTGNAG